MKLIKHWDLEYQEVDQGIGRGGQSVLQFARLRMEKCPNYVRKTAKLATQFFYKSCRRPVQCCRIDTYWFGWFPNGIWDLECLEEPMHSISIDKVEYVIHFEDGIEELQQFVGLWQALNDILDNVEKKSLPIPVWSMRMTTKQTDLPLKSLNYGFACYFLSIGLSCLPRSEVIWYYHDLTYGPIFIAWYLWEAQKLQSRLVALSLLNSIRRGSFKGIFSSFGLSYWKH